MAIYSHTVYVHVIIFKGEFCSVTMMTLKSVNKHEEHIAYTQTSTGITKTSHLVLRTLTEIWFTQYDLILKLQHRQTQSAVCTLISAHPVTGDKGQPSLPSPAG